MRSIWTGTVRFGEVAIPVGISPTVKKGGTSFRTLHRPCQQPTKSANVCAEHGVVPAEELVKGYEVAPGQFVLVEDVDLEALIPDSDRTIAIAACVRADDLDPFAVERRYYLTPAPTAIGRKPYLLLRQALIDTETVALGRFIAFGSEWLVAIGAHEKGSRTMLLSKLTFVDDLLPATEIEDTLASVESPSAEETELAAQLAEQLRPFRLRKALLTSDHRERVEQLVEAKLSGAKIVIPAKPAAAGSATPQLPGLDLADLLRRSIKKKPRTRATAGSR